MAFNDRFVFGMVRPCGIGYESAMRGIFQKRLCESWRVPIGFIDACLQIVNHDGFLACPQQSFAALGPSDRPAYRQARRKSDSSSDGRSLYATGCCLISDWNSNSEKITIRANQENPNQA